MYVGVTSNLIKRIWEHKNNLVEGFTKRYQIHVLVWFEVHETLESALVRERQIKRWKRDWKINLIEAQTPQWVDLYPSLSP